MAHAAVQAPVGNLISHYQILAQIGIGGMGVVFKAFDTKLQRTVALKFLIPDASQSAADRERLLHEARAASALEHKNIAMVHCVDETEDGQLFIDMAYYDGESLAARMRRTEFSPLQAADVVMQIAAGLEHAHLHHIVHRDIKPSNIILTSENEAKIVDFGLARFTGADASTQSMGIAGTLSYMSPEQVAGRVVDARTDLWSLGVIAYELLCKRLPFDGGSPAAKMHAIMHAHPPEMSGVPEALQKIVHRCLAKHVESRYPSCAELLRELEHFVRCTTAPVETVEGSARRWIGHAISRTRGTFASRRLLTGAVAFVVLTAILLSPPVRTRVSKMMGAISSLGNRYTGADATGRGAQGVPPAAYETYLKGVEYLKRYDKPDSLNSAIKMLQTTTETDPHFALAFAALGEAFWDKYRLDPDPRWIEQASAYCERAIQLNDRLPATYVTLGRIHNGTGQHELAMQEFQRALDLEQWNVDALLGQADLYANIGRVDEAEDEYKKAVALRPESWEGYQRLGFFYFRQHRFEDAATQFRRLLELVPDSATGHTNYGVMLRNLGREKDAEVELKKSIDLSPTYNAYATLGNLYYNQKRYAESVEMTNKALQINQKDYRVWANLALAYDWLDQANKAKETYRKELPLLEQAARLAPNDAALQAELGLVYAKVGQVGMAVQRVEAALGLSPQDPTTLAVAGEAYVALGERAKGVQLIRQSIVNGLKFEELETDPDARPLLSDPKIRRQLQASKNS